MDYEGANLKQKKCSIGYHTMLCSVFCFILMVMEFCLFIAFPLVVAFTIFHTILNAT